MSSATPASFASGPAIQHTEFAREEFFRGGKSELDVDLAALDLAQIRREQGIAAGGAFLKQPTSAFEELIVGDLLKTHKDLAPKDA